MWSICKRYTTIPLATLARWMRPPCIYIFPNNHIVEGVGGKIADFKPLVIKKTCFTVVLVCMAGVVQLTSETTKCHENNLYLTHACDYEESIYGIHTHTHTHTHVYCNIFAYRNLFVYGNDTPVLNLRRYASFVSILCCLWQPSIYNVLGDHRVTEPRPGTLVYFSRWWHMIPQHPQHPSTASVNFLTTVDDYRYNY